MKIGIKLPFLIMYKRRKTNFKTILFFISKFKNAYFWGSPNFFNNFFFLSFSFWNNRYTNVLLESNFENASNFKFVFLRLFFYVRGSFVLTITKKYWYLSPLEFFKNENFDACSLVHRVHAHPNFGFGLLKSCLTLG